MIRVIEVRIPGINKIQDLLGRNKYAPVHGNEFIWQGYTYKVIVKNELAWLDRNLGASRVAISSDDEQSYGDLYQWGRLADGHEKINRFIGDGKTTSGTTDTLSSNDIPGHSEFITAGGIGDWRNPQNDILWHAVGGINNPSPPGWRIPTELELDIERLSWDTDNAAGAFASSLRLPLGGFRRDGTGLIDFVGSGGYYWSSIESFGRAWGFQFLSSSAGMVRRSRANGYSVRCVRTLPS